MHKNYFILILLLLSALIGVPAGAEEVSVLLTVDKTSLAMGDTVVAQVTVKGAQQADQPSLLKVHSFDVSPAGRSSRINIVNGVVQAETIFSFILRPKNTGKFIIGPAAVNVNGVSFQSNQVEFSVQEGTPQKAEERTFYITVDVSNTRPYVGEQIVYTFRLFNRAALAKAEMRLPDFSGFLKEDLGQQKASDQVINGVKWHIAEIRYALFPLMGGEMTIPPAVLMADVMVRNQVNPAMPFFSGNSVKRTEISSNAISLLVSRPPSAGEPPGYKGLVGDVTLTGSASKQTMNLGESTTLTLTVKGNANIRDFQFDLPELTDFKVYDDKPTFSIESEGNRVVGKKVFKKALVPIKGGEVDIPAITVAYFDPVKKAYQSAKTKPIRLNVAGAGTEKTDIVTLETGQKKEVTVVGRDLMPIKRDIEALNDDALSSGAKKGVLVTIFVCFILYGLIVMLKTRRDRLLEDRAYVRREKAYKRFQIAAKTFSNGGAFFETASGAFRTYLGDRFDLDGLALTSADAHPKLRPLGVSEEAIAKIEAFLRTCEAAQYGGVAHANHTVPMEELTGLVLELEKGGFKS